MRRGDHGNHGHEQAQSQGKNGKSQQNVHCQFKVHGEVREATFACQECNMVFVAKGGLKKYVETII